MNANSWLFPWQRWHRLLLSNDSSEILRISHIDILGSLFCRLFVDDVHHLSLNCFLFEDKPIFVPNEIWIFCVKSMPLQTAFKKTDDVTVVWVLREWEASAVMHEFFEFFWLILAQVLNCGFLLFLFNGCIFFSLWSAGQSLPWKGSLQEVKDHMTDGLKIISSRLLVS